VYLENDTSVRAVVEAILCSPEFVSDRAYRGLIKSPTELVVGTLRAVGAEEVPAGAAQAMRLLGQELFNPTNVAGWFGGRSWINAATLLGRFNLVGQIAAQVGGPVLGGQVPTSLFVAAQSNEERVQRVLDLLVDGEVVPEERSMLLEFANQARGEEQIRGLLRLTMALPVYQLN